MLRSSGRDLSGLRRQLLSYVTAWAKIWRHADDEFERGGHFLERDGQNKRRMLHDEKWVSVTESLDVSSSAALILSIRF